jgi:NADPH:quinone reductase-like Zn-dependent oxidoreductase
MRAAFYTRYGPPEVVSLRDVEPAVPVGDQIAVRVQVASVNRADLDALGPRPGFLRLFTGLRRPRNGRVGLDVAGIVESVGPGATRFRVGDRVFADLFPYGAGAFAERVVAKEAAFLAIPDGLSFADAATLPHAAVLAIQSLRVRDGRTIEPGMRVLVDGASGNVGPFAVQIAKAMGAKVTGVARTEKLEFVRSLGADAVLDYTTTDYTRASNRYDWIVDVDSHHGILAARRALEPRGVYVTLGGTTWPILSALTVGAVASAATSRSSGLMLGWKPFSPPDVARLTELIAAGQLRPAIDRTFPLEEIVPALRSVGDGQARGKVLVVP